MIGISSGCTVQILNKTIDSIFNTIVLIVGIEEIKSQRNIERLKRELRVITLNFIYWIIEDFFQICYPLIDRLLDSLDCGDSSNKHSSDLVGMAETILCPENHLIQVFINFFFSLCFNVNLDSFRYFHRMCGLVI